MTRSLILSNQEHMADAETSVILVPTIEDLLEMPAELPLACLDPSHPALSAKARMAVLEARYRSLLIRDGLETGHYVLGPGGQLQARTKLPWYSFAGLVMESYVVHRLSDRMRTAGRAALEWCTKRRGTRDKYVDRFRVVGTSLNMAMSYPGGHHNLAHRMDIVFLELNNKEKVYQPALVQGTTIQAGIQVKAITGNEMEEIIKPILSGTYSCVLTMLRRPDGMHTYQACMSMALDMYRKGQIFPHQFALLEYAIRSPDAIGLDQYEIDHYYAYIRAVTTQGGVMDPMMVEGLALEIKSQQFGNALTTPAQLN